MKILCIAVSLVALVVAQQSTEVKPPQPVPQPASPNQKQGGADGTAFSQPQGFSFPVPAYPQTAFQPTHQNVCDFDAAILVTVTASQKDSQTTEGAYGQTPFLQQYPALTLARRFKCADVALLDGDSCTTCCRLSARTPTSTIRMEEIEGILIDRTKFVVDIATEPANPSEGYRKDRTKRTIDDTPKISTPDARYNRKFRCMCCAPREAHIAQPFSPYAFTQQFGR
uniref:Uncharacterized protein n=1 Tax=Steinernema glaseri TaxID=37863 RepID=A0A1I7YMX2_9BILA